MNENQHAKAIDRTIDSHIKRLCKKLKLVDEAFDMIETLLWRRLPLQGSPSSLIRSSVSRYPHHRGNQEVVVVLANGFLAPMNDRASVISVERSSVAEFSRVIIGDDPDSRRRERWNSGRVVG